MSEWISVKDKQPKSYELVLSFHRYAHEWDVYVCTYAPVSHDPYETDYCFHAEEGRFRFTSTHWMPITPPPKDEA